ncbi:hypothetical protein K474DRAFT_1588531 [Panus rudis PR-1116 ss-1]|nr:hypothetical protein K474DRAFT_1588531 [Panus rudis PR-1116 ss-1]
MPSFAARQRIQKKYQVDRRHIYDWYHTKGLRVSSKSRTENDLARTNIIEEGRSLRPRYPVSNIRYFTICVTEHANPYLPRMN